MPARKSSVLIVRDETRVDRQSRVDGESAMTPKTDLSRKPPKLLNGHKVASTTWTRVVSLYFEIDGKIATAFDSDLLVKYCLLEEEVIELSDLRVVIKKEWQEQLKQAKRIKPNDKNLKEWGRMWDVVNGLFQRFQGMDARLDGKRKLLHALSQSLYLTPRSRAGVAPPTKEPDEPKSEMEELL
jgi:phage terminase small subunit